MKAPNVMTWICDGNGISKIDDCHYLMATALLRYFSSKYRTPRERDRKKR